MIATVSIPVLIVDDQMVLRVGLRATLGLIPDVTVVGEASDGECAIEMVKQLRPAIVLMDVTMPKLDGIQATRIIKENYAETRVIIFTSSADDKVFSEALAAGADGYCVKDATKDQLAAGINAVMQGAKWVDAGIADRILHAAPPSRLSGEKAPYSSEQMQILEMIGAGLGICEIAEGLNKQITDVKVQLKSITESLRSPELLDKSADSAVLELKALLESSAGTRLMPRMSDNWVGQLLSGKYLVEETLGTGGMSVVYRARHLAIGKEVAIKMLHRDLLKEATSAQRMQREAQAASSISHPNIVAIHDFGITDDGQPYLVMDYVDGDTLETVLKKYKKLDARRCILICLDICDALAAVHSKGIIHRDLKPSNIMLIEEKGKLVAKLFDFGIAVTISEDAAEHRLTLIGAVIGSPGFMSPEQISGQTGDQRSDLYALGCIMYEMLAGEEAFGGDMPFYNVMWRQINEPPSRMPFLTVGNQVPQGLEAAVFKHLHKNPDKRFQTAKELKIELERLRDSDYLVLEVEEEINDCSFE